MLSIGLTPRKSLTLKELGVPEKYFFDFLRGLIDGDGCIRRWIHPFNGREQWSLRIFSGSTAFINWLSQRMSLLLSAKGKIYRNSTQSRCYVLKFGKMAARNIAMQCYYPGAFALERKSVLADECVNSYIGWSKSKTVLN
jgi:hypothetical protein